MLPRRVGRRRQRNVEGWLAEAVHPQVVPVPYQSALAVESSLFVSAHDYEHEALEAPGTQAGQEGRSTHFWHQVDEIAQ